MLEFEEVSTKAFKEYLAYYMDKIKIFLSKILKRHAQQTVVKHKPSS